VLGSTSDHLQFSSEESSSGQQPVANSVKCGSRTTKRCQLPIHVEQCGSYALWLILIRCTRNEIRQVAFQTMLSNAA